MGGGEIRADRPAQIGPLSKVESPTIGRRDEPDEFTFGRLGNGSLNLAGGCRSQIPWMCRWWMGFLSFTSLVDTRRFQWWRVKIINSEETEFQLQECAVQYTLRIGRLFQLSLSFLRFQRGDYGGISSWIGSNNLGFKKQRSEGGWLEISDGLRNFWENCHEDNLFDNITENSFMHQKQAMNTKAMVVVYTKDMDGRSSTKGKITIDSQAGTSHLVPGFAIFTHIMTSELKLVRLERRMESNFQS